VQERKFLEVSYENKQKQKTIKAFQHEINQWWKKFPTRDKGAIRNVGTGNSCGGYRNRTFCVTLTNGNSVLKEI
jgi:hypothetical protein